jgi:hypothetical protein
MSHGGPVGGGGGGGVSSLPVPVRTLPDLERVVIVCLRHAVSHAVAGNQVGCIHRDALPETQTNDAF